MGNRYSDDKVEIAAEMIHETELAYLLNDGDAEAWVPKSEVDDLGGGVWEMPEWLAVKRGFY